MAGFQQLSAPEESSTALVLPVAADLAPLHTALALLTRPHHAWRAPQPSLPPKSSVSGSGVGLPVGRRGRGVDLDALLARLDQVDDVQFALLFVLACICLDSPT
jgi:hypothetical protein